MFAPVPARGIEPGCCEHSKPATRHHIDPAGIGKSYIDQRGDAAQQQVAIGNLGAKFQPFGFDRVSTKAFVQPGHVVLANAVILADAAEKRFARGMRVDIDQPGNETHARPVDNRVGGAVKGHADEGDFSAGKNQIAATQIHMAPPRVIPGDDPIDVGEMRCRHR